MRDESRIYMAISDKFLVNIFGWRGAQARSTKIGMRISVIEKQGLDKSERPVQNSF